MDPRGAICQSVALGRLVARTLALPVMLVIGTFSEEDERSAGRQKVEFADVRWMEITSMHQRESANGTNRR